MMLKLKPYETARVFAKESDFSRANKIVSIIRQQEGQMNTL